MVVVVVVRIYVALDSVIFLSLLGLKVCATDPSWNRLFMRQGGVVTAEVSLVARQDNVTEPFKLNTGPQC